MKKTININLGGYPFIIDDDAYRKLENYLDTIRRHFSYSEGCDEIMEDIEIRMSELLESKLKTHQIITTKNIDAVIETLGKPQDFGAEAIENDFQKEEPKTEHYEYRTGKKLYRDIDRKVLGGVVAGFASYFGISNLFIFRIIILLFMTSGLPLFVYLVLWMVLPAAETVSEKLEMQGKPVNVSNIARKVEQEISDLGKIISDIGRDFKNRKNQV